MVDIQKNDRNGNPVLKPSMITTRPWVELTKLTSNYTACTCFEKAINGTEN